jgi:glycosyltransferase involved in cell wall biosynthesis
MPAPEISIVVPAFNEERFIDLTLNSIDRHLRDVNFEVIVVDNGSTDRTAEFAARHSSVKVMSIARGTISAARNTGAAAARGRLLVFLDGDVEITADWVAATKHRLNNVDLQKGYLGGYRLGVPDNASVIERTWFATLALRRPTYLGGANILVAPSTFHALRGFDEQLITGEDVDFCRRAELLNVTIDFSPELRAIHLGFPTTLGGFTRREIWHGTGDFQSLTHFVHSKAAIAAVLFLLSGLAAAVFVLAGFTAFAGALLIAHLALPLVFAVYQFRLRNARYLPMQYLLSYTYLCARAYSAIRSLF